MKTMRVVRVVAALRAAFGVALTFRTETMLRLMVKDAEPTGSLLMFVRTVGLRDMVFGLAALIDSFTEPERADRWVRIWIASDVADVIAGATSSRHVGVGGALAATAASLPFAASDIWALRKLTSYAGVGAVEAR